MTRKVLHLRGSNALFGAENVVLELARHSARFGFESILGLPCAPGAPLPELGRRARELGIRTLALPCRGRLDPGFALRLRRTVAAEGIDVVHTHGYKEDFYALLSGSDVPLVATNHNWTRTTRALALYSRLDAYLLRRFDRVVAVSEPLLAEMRRAGVPVERLSRIDNGIDVDRFRRVDPARRQALRAEFGVPANAPVAMMVGRLGPEKGHRFALGAFAAVAAAHPEARLLIVGDGAEREALGVQAQMLGIASRVVFCGRRSDIAELLAASDIFLQPSLNEGLPMSLLEAMAAGSAVIASDVGSVSRAVEHERTGLLLPAGDERALSLALARLLEQPGQRSALAHQAQQRVEQHFSSRQMARAYCEVYRQAGVPAPQPPSSRAGENTPAALGLAAARRGSVAVAVDDAD